MLYNSIEFGIMFIIAVIVYYIIPKKQQWKYLLVVSYLFYSSFSLKYTILLISVTTITYFIAIYIDNCNNLNKKRRCMIGGVILNIFLLSIFKYSQWICTVFIPLEERFFLKSNASVFNLAIPVGISFYTFRIISYLVDVYRGKVKSEKNLGKYALYLSFFPQIVSGPIERSYNFFPQLEQVHFFDYEKVKQGFWLFIWGLLKKIVIADRLAILVNQIFDNVPEYSTPYFLVAILFFTFQIYFDFAGYSDMAIGCTKMLGMTSIANFDKPYFSRSISEFWRRWHISLSTWFRDYLYIPLGGNRVTKKRWTINMMIVFIVSGLWHGANWTFCVWGALHGVYQVAGKITREKRDRLIRILHINKAKILYKILATIITFILVAYAWMFFRANTIEDAIYITKAILIWDFSSWDISLLGMPKYDLIFSLIILVFYFVLELLQQKMSLWNKLQAQILPVRWGIYLLVLFVCIMFGIYGNLSSSTFVYFQF